MSEEIFRLLLIEHSDEYAGALREILSQAKALRFELEQRRSFAEGMARLAEGGIDVLLLSLSLPDAQGLEYVDQAKEQAAHVPIIVLSGSDDERLAVRAVQEGAQDYLVKGQTDRPLLVRSIRYAIERKRAELSLIQLEEKYRSIVENTVEGIFQTSESGQYLSANPPLARIYGYDSPGELMAKLTNIAGQLYVEPGRRDEFRRLMQVHNVVTNFESRIYRKDGSVIWISENVRAVRNAQGKLLYYEGTVQDITERKLAEEKLRNSETLYHSLVENLPQNIFRKDLSERFTFANQRFCAALGRPLEQILGKTDFDFFPPKLAEKYQKDDREILQTGRIFEAIEEHQPPRGDKIYVNVVKTPIYDSEGKIIGLQGIFWDITEKIRADQELARHREELRSKNEQMEEDLVMAREIQQAILPQQYPTFPRGVDPKESALQFFHRYFPTGAVGGDFFNILTLSDTKAGIFICDVMGHGVRSALVTAIMRALVEELTRLATVPGELLSQINRDLRAILKQTGTPMFTTAFYLVVDLEKRLGRFANAGHPRPLLARRRTGQVEPMKNTDGVARPALGLFDDTEYPTYEIPLEEQDLIMLFTDGLYDIEGPRSDEISPEWLLCETRQRIALPAPLLFDEILAELKSASASGHFADDVCLVGVELARL